MLDVLVVSNTLVVAGGATDDLRPVVWVSSDLLSWVRTDLPGKVTDEPIVGVSVINSLLVAVGRSGHVWLGTLPPLAN